MYGIVVWGVGALMPIHRVFAQDGDVMLAAELATQKFYVRFLGIGFAMALVVVGILIGIVVFIRRLFASQAADFHKQLEKLHFEIRARDQQLELLTEKEVSKANEVARLKNEFIFIAAHELRAPVAAIEGNISLFIADMQEKPLPKEQMEILGDVRIAAERLSQLVMDLLNVARIESGTIRIAFEKTTIDEAVIGAIRDTAALSVASNVRVVFDESELARGVSIMGDTQRLREVFGNLLSNSIKYNVSGGLVRIAVEVQGEYLVASVSDAGIGMGEEDLAHLFTKFWRANPSIEGTGLGLWITKQIVERMHGTISVESTKGIGTTFRVCLKVVV